MYVFSIKRNFLWPNFQLQYLTLFILFYTNSRNIFRSPCAWLLVTRLLTYFTRFLILIESYILSAFDPTDLKKKRNREKIDENVKEKTSHKVQRSFDEKSYKKVLAFQENLKLRKLISSVRHPRFHFIKEPFSKSSCLVYNTFFWRTLSSPNLFLSDDGVIILGKVQANAQVGEKIMSRSTGFRLCPNWR